MGNFSEADFFSTAALSLSGRYAKALLSLSEEEKITDETLKCLENFEKLIKKSAELENIFYSKAVDRADHSKLVKKIGQILDFPLILISFLQKLAENRRLSILTDIIYVYGQLIDQRSAVHSLSVLSAYPLTVLQKKKLKALFSYCFSQAFKVDFFLDKSLLGGILIRDGDRVIDTSVRSQLNQLATIMKGTA